MKNKRASISLYFTLIVTAFILITIAAVIVPMGISFNSQMYAAGEKMLIRGNESIQAISDVNVKNTLTNAINEAKDSAAFNIEVNAGFFKYSWILVLGLSSLIVFIYTRKVTEYQTGGFV